MKKILIEDLQGPMSYDAYIAQIQDVIQSGSMNVLSYDTSQLEFTELNMKRMDRWKRRFDKQGFSASTNFDASSLTWLVITEGWCGDAAHILPVIGRLAKELDQMRLIFINRDLNHEIMDEFLTNGGRAIPMLIVLNNEGHVVGQWGPRPKELQDYFIEEKRKPDFSYPEVQIGLQSWYNKDKGQTTASEIMEMMESISK